MQKPVLESAKKIRSGLGVVLSEHFGPRVHSTNTIVCFKGCQMNWRGVHSSWCPNAPKRVAPVLSRVEKACKECGGRIVDRPHNALYCLPCLRLFRNRSYGTRTRQNWVNGKCPICASTLEGRSSTAIFCLDCIRKKRSLSWRKPQ